MAGSFAEKAESSRGGPSQFPQARVQEATESHRTALLKPDEVREYCQKLFEFKSTTYKKFRRVNI
jgi:hypothetical protein